MAIIAARELFFSRTLDPTKARKRYLALTKVLHPDVETGDTVLMQRLNAEFDAFQNGTLQSATVEPQPQPQAPPPPPKPQYDYYDPYEAIRRAGESLIANLPYYLRSNISFVVIAHDNRVEARGETFDWKDELKARGFRWDKPNKVWYTEAM